MQSKKHHYLPRFYLKGFADADNRFYVLDKASGKIWQSTPEQSFCENRRNTGAICDIRTKEVIYTDFAEEALSRIDNRAALVFQEIAASSAKGFDFNVERTYAIRTLLASIFWRTPANDELRNEIIFSTSFAELGFGIHDEITGKRMPEQEEHLKQIEIWQKLYPMLLTTTAFLPRNSPFNFPDWRLYYREEGACLISDNPIIFRDFKGVSSLHGELISPISRKNILVSTPSCKTPVLPKLFSLKLDLLLFHNAKQYVASARKHYLELMAEEAPKLISDEWYRSTVKEMFAYFY